MNKVLRSLLYVDDEPDIREIVQMALELEGDLQVRTCESGVLALPLLLRWMPDLVMLDVMMPELNGPGTLQKMRGDPVLRDIPAVFMTAKAQPQEIAQLLEQGAIGLISKPFEPMRLAAQVRELWARAYSLEQRPERVTSEKRGLLELRTQELGVRYLQRTGREVDRVRELAANWQDANAAATLAAIGALAHRIHGSGATFGFAGVSAAAAAIEHMASAAEAQGIDTAAAFVEQFAGLLETLDGAVQAAMKDRGIGAGQT